MNRLWLLEARGNKIAFVCTVLLKLSVVTNENKANGGAGSLTSNAPKPWESLIRS